MTTHKHYESAKRAYAWTSFSSEKRAISECQYFDEIMQEFCDKPEIQAKFEKLFLASLSAKSKCMSAMITGPARFPAQRAQRANERERKTSDMMLDYIDRARKNIEKEKLREASPELFDEEEIAGVKIIKNTQDMRLQLLFEGKPPQPIIALLKSNGFRWAPSNKAWQRQLTNNAIHAFESRIKPSLMAGE